MNETKNCTVTIFGDAYCLVTNELPERVVQAAAMVDEIMKDIAKHGSSIDAKKCAVLAALRIASSKILLESEHDYQQKQQEHLINLIDRVL